MVPRKPSQSAVLVAAARALHREEAPPHVLDDWLALPLAGADASALAERLRTDLPREALLGFSRWLCVRARVPEDITEQEAQRGVRQYVILGAGLDSYAYRRPDLEDKLRIFEVDHPASQEWKRQRLAELEIRVPPNLVFAPVDFEHQALREGLEAAGFDWNASAVFAWIGVTMYLSMDAIRSTLETVAAGAAGTRIVLTYNQPPSVLQGMGIETSQALRPILDEMGEPIITTFVPSEIEELLRGIGFVDVTHFGPEEAISTYFGGRENVRFGGAQRIAIASVAG